MSDGSLCKWSSENKRGWPSIKRVHRIDSTVVTDLHRRDEYGITREEGNKYSNYSI